MLIVGNLTYYNNSHEGPGHFKKYKHFFIIDSKVSKYLAPLGKEYIFYNM